MCHTWGLARSSDELHVEVPLNVPDLVHLMVSLFKLSVEVRIILRTPSDFAASSDPLKVKNIEKLYCEFSYQFSNILSQTRLISIASKPIKIVFASILEISKEVASG
jgi:hypothetical protein